MSHYSMLGASKAPLLMSSKLKTALLTSTAVMLALSPSTGFAADETYDTGTTVVNSAEGADNFFIGDLGTATVNVVAGGSLTSTADTILGNTATGVGTLSVDSATGAATADRFYVGLEGSGTLNASNGASVSTTGTNKTYFGYFYESTGSGTFSDSGTTLSTGELNVGWTGNADLTIESGADVTALSDIQISRNSPSVSSITVTGLGSTMTSDRLYVGLLGTATLDILDGAQVSTSGTNKTYLGYFAGGSGTATVSGAGSSLSTGELNVGWGGEGKLTVTDSATVTAAADITLAQDSGSSADVTVSDGGSMTGDRLIVGANASGNMSILSGGSVSTTGTNETYLGYYTGGSGTVTVGGAGSSLTTGALNVGWNSEGKLTVTDGAIVTAATDITLAANSGSSGDVTVSNGGSMTSDRLYVGGNLNGNLSILSGGTVSTSGTNKTFIGYNFPSVSTAIVDGAGSTLSTGILSVGWGGVGTLTVSNGGAVDAVGTVILGEFSGSAGSLVLASGGTTTIDSGNGTLIVAELAGSTGTLNIGAAAGDTAQAAGILNAATVSFQGGTGKVVFNHTETAYDFDADITGTGTVDVYSGTTTLTGTSTYTGATSIYGGKLLVNGSIASTVNVQDGGIIGGAGTIGSLVALAGGIVSPGNSIDTLNVAGDASFAAGSIFDLEVNNAGNSDLLAVGGSVTIDPGATVSITNLSGGLPPLGTPYTFITAVGGVTGQFTVTDEYAYFSDYFTYGGTSVSYTFDRNAKSFDDAVGTVNQKGAASGVESLGAGDTLYDAALYVKASEAASAFAQLSGELHPLVGSLLMSRSSLSRDVIGNVIRSAPKENKRFWTSAFGSWSDADADGNSFGGRANGGGFMFGGDAPVGEGWRVGYAGGYGRDTISSELGASQADVDSYYVAAYGGKSFGPIALSLGAIHAIQKIETERSVNFSTFSDRLTADYSASTSQLFAEGAWHLEGAPAQLEPYASVAYVHGHASSFTETGGASALTADTRNSDQLATTFGIRAAQDIAVLGMSGKVTGGLGWRHTFGDMKTETQASFTGSTPFKVEGPDQGRDAALVNAGLGFDVTEYASISIDYSGSFNNDAHENAGSMTFRMSF